MRYKIPSLSDRYAEERVKYDEACSKLFNWKDCAIENEKEYSDRIKKIKFLKIVKSIFENDLNDKQKDMLRLKFCENKSGEDIAEIYGQNRSTVCRAIKKAESIIKENMRYVFEYANLREYMNNPPICVASAISTITFCASRPDTVGKRIKKERIMRMLTPEDVSAATKISPIRLSAIENSSEFTYDEFVRLVIFFSVSADKLIFGV